MTSSTSARVASVAPNRHEHGKFRVGDEIRDVLHALRLPFLAKGRQEINQEQRRAVVVGIGVALHGI